jgi:hypothetical protein
MRNEIGPNTVPWGTPDVTDITLQSNLKWNLHYDNIISNENKFLGFLKRNLTVSNTDNKSRAYQELVRPKLEYSCSMGSIHCIYQ